MRIVLEIDDAVADELLADFEESVPKNPESIEMTAKEWLASRIQGWLRSQICRGREKKQLDSIRSNVAASVSSAVSITVEKSDDRTAI
jgi:hypothetical protein